MPANSLPMIEQAQFQQALIMFAETCIFTLGRGEFANH